jgi:hypothetical protein
VPLERGKGLEGQLKSRKSSENNIVFENKVGGRTKGVGDLSPLGFGEKYRKASCNYEAMGVDMAAGKQPRFSMV